MGTTDRVLMLKLLGDTSDIVEGTKKTTGRLKKMGAAAKSWGRAWTKSLVLDGLNQVTDAVTGGIQGFKDGEAAAKNLGATWRNLGLDGSKLATTIESISNTAIDLGFDDTDTVRGYDVFIKKTRDTTKASKLMALAFDIARAENIPLAQAVKKAGQIYDGSGKAVKQYGLKGKTAMERVAEARKIERGKAAKWAKDHPMEVLTGKINEGFEELGAVLVPLSETAATFVQTNIVPVVVGFRDALGGGELVAQVVLLAAAVGALALVSYAHPLIALAAAVVALTAVTAVAVKDDWLGQLTTNLNNDRQAMADGSRDVDTFGQALVHLADLANDTVGPVLRPFWSIIGGLWDTAMGVITLDFDTFLKGLGSQAQGVVDLILSPFQLVWNLVKAGFALLGIDIGAFFASLPDTMLRFAADIGQTAWDIGSAIAVSLMNGIGDLAGRVGGVIGDILGKVSGAVRSAAIAVATAWNQLGAYGAGSVHIFDAGSFGIAGTPFYAEWGAFDIGWGAGDLIPNISLPGGGGRNQLGVPGYEKGLWDVPFDNYPAMLHRRETVLPADFAEEYRRSVRSGRDGGPGRGGDIFNITVHAAMGADGVRIGRDVVNAIRAYQRNGGAAAVKAAVLGG